MPRPKLPYCLEIPPPLPNLTGNYTVLEAAHSPAQRSKSVYQQHRYSADTIIQTVVNVIRDWKCNQHATTVIAHSFLPCISTDPGDLAVWLLHMPHG